MSITTMLHPTIEQHLRVQMSKLALEQQQQVLAFARALAEQHPAGVPGNAYGSFAGSIAPEDLEQMAAAIEEGCERVDNHEW